MGKDEKITGKGEEPYAALMSDGTVDLAPDGNEFRLPSIKELESCDRPFERALEHGVSSLAAADLIALIWRSGQPGVPITELCRNIMSSVQGKFHNLAKCSFEDLTAFKGVGRVKAMQLMAVMEIVKRFNGEKLADLHKISTSRTAATIMTYAIGNESTEHLMLLCLNNNLGLIKVCELSRGGATASIFDLKRALKLALMCEAQAVMMCHNHPSGNMTPSASDDQITCRMKEGCQAIGLRFLDHIIVGAGTHDTPSYYSYNDQGRL